MAANTLNMERCAWATNLLNIVNVQPVHDGLIQARPIATVSNTIYIYSYEMQDVYLPVAL